MLEEAYRLLGVTSDADGRTIEAAYWRRARELGEERRTSSGAAEELERVNEAYQMLVDHKIKEPTVRRAPGRRSLLRRIALSGVLAAVVTGGVVVGLDYREEVRDMATSGYERAQNRWDKTITWLQSIDQETAPESEDSTSR